MAVTGGAPRHRDGSPRLAVALLAFAAALPAVAGVSAQQAPVAATLPGRSDIGAEKRQPEGSVETERERERLRDVEEGLSAADRRRRETEAEIESLRGDRARLTAALIDATNHVREAETGVAGIEERLDTLTGSEEAINRSLASRRAVIGEVLAVLQRMGRKPLPAILARPEDMLLAIRTSMLLGSLVPDLRAETEALASDLEELSRVRQSVTAQRDTLSQKRRDLTAEQASLGALIEARRTAQAVAEGSLATEQREAAGLAREAGSLKDLIARLEGDAAVARRTAEAEAESVNARASAGDGKDVARLAPAVAFADVKGSLPLPAAGTIVKRFGASDGFGSTEHGLSLATRAQAVVSTPADGWVSFSGPYRSYGQLLIINAGGGYYIVLTGMERTNVTPGQFVVAGEPVGTMGDGSARAATAIALGGAEPVLYVEFRKDGTAIDPSPWWAKSELAKARG